MFPQCPLKRVFSADNLFLFRLTTNLPLLLLQIYSSCFSTFLSLLRVRNDCLYYLYNFPGYTQFDCQKNCSYFPPFFFFFGCGFVHFNKTFCRMHYSCFTTITTLSGPRLIHALLKQLQLVPDLMKSHQGHQRRRPVSYPSWNTWNFFNNFEHMRPRLLDKLTQVAQWSVYCGEKAKVFASASAVALLKGATPSRQAAVAPLLYNRHADLKQFVINFRVGKKKVDIKTQNFFFTLVVAVSLAPD